MRRDCGPGISWPSGRLDGRPESGRWERIASAHFCRQPSCGPGSQAAVNDGRPAGELPAAPGTEQPRRDLPRLRYELIGCGLHGHELLGTDAASLRPEDSLFARESGGLRWYRCLRCDSRVALSPPSQPAVQYPPPREEISLPLRGRPLRERYILRLIAIDRLTHFLVLSALAAASRSCSPATRRR